MQREQIKERIIHKLGKKSRGLRVAAALLACLILAGTSFVVYSKYYKTGYNKGMAVASGFYFSSNYMTELDLEQAGVKEIQSIEELQAQTDLLNSLYVKAADTPWNTEPNGSTVSTTILLDIDNYSNQILYNDEDLDISYQVEFILLDEPSGVTYQIAKGTEGQYQPLTQNPKVVFTGDLEGGKLSWDTYRIRVAIADINRYTPARILALAYPTSPSYVKNTRKIAGIITGDYQASEIEITEQGFTIEKELEEAGDWKKAASEESALVYQIRTTGNYFGDGESGYRQKIKLTWDPEMYKLNKYDKYRLELEKKYEGSPDELKQYLDEEQGFMIVEILPYSSIKFVFYKAADGTTGFDQKLQTFSDLEAFKQTVQAEKIDD